MSIPAALLLVVGLMHGSSPAGTLERADTVHVQIRGSVFAPAELRIAPGTVVVWTNHDPLVHTATARDGTWGSAALLAGDRYAHRFDDAGRHDYLCLPHPMMAGVIHVDADPDTGSPRDAVVSAAPEAAEVRGHRTKSRSFPGGVFER
jgi:plastocyanin